MDNFDKLDEPVISSSGRKRKIKAETFSQKFAKAARYNGEGKALCIACNHIHTVYDHNSNICQASTLSSEEITKIKRVVFFFFFFNTLKHEMWNYLLLPKNDCWSYLHLL